MLSQYIDVFINYLIIHSDFLSAYFPLLVFFTALIESIPVLGALIPGTLFLLFFGFSGSILKVNIPFMIFAATIASIIGDILGYIFGRYGTKFLLKHKKLLKMSHIEEGKKFFSNHGFKSIFLGKFIGPIRAILPLIAGSVHLRFSRFMFYNILASFTWASLYIIIGYYFGNYFREIEAFISNTSIILTLIIVGLFMYYYFKKKKDKENHENQ